MNIIDLSVPLAHDHPSELEKPQITHIDHTESAEQVAGFFGATVDQLPGGFGWGNDSVTAGVHSGTHVDAPWHYYPTAGGEPARTIDQLPLDWFVRPGVRLDVRHVEQGGLITVEHLQQALGDYVLQPFDIVLLWTGTDAAWGRPDYPVTGSGLGRASTLWLLEQGVKVIGTDCWGLDRPFTAMKEEFDRTGDPDVIWEAHRAGIEREYCQIEKLCNLAALPGRTGFEVSCLPVKVEGASGGWCRAAAIVR